MSIPAPAPSELPVQTSPQRVAAVRRRGSPIPLRYAAGRVGGAAVSMLAVVLTGFFLFRILPGDPVRALTRGRPVDAAQLAALRRQFGLDRPLVAQFASYAGHVARGDLGTSYQYKSPVRGLITSHLWPTVYLVGTATVIAAALGLTVGIRSAWRAGSRADRANTGVALVLWSMPTFWLGLIADRGVRGRHRPDPRAAADRRDEHAGRPRLLPRALRPPAAPGAAAA